MDAKFRVILVLFLRESGVSQVLLSKAAGFSQAIVSNVIHGHVKLTPNIANRLADAMLEIAG